MVLMTNITPLGRFQPTWDYDSDGTRQGISFICPDCPPDTCRITKIWGPRSPHLGENFTSIPALTIEDLGPGSREGCEFKGKIQAGAIFWWE